MILLSPVPITDPEHLRGPLLFIASEKEPMVAQVTEQYQRAPEPKRVVLLAHVRHPTKAAFIELAYLIGVRKGQLRQTELRNVRVEQGRVTALVWEPEKVKTRKPHEVPLVGRGQEIVQQLWDNLHQPRSSKVAVLKLPPFTLLFQVNGAGLKELRSEWNSACKKAEFPVGRKMGGFTFHNTRHSCLTNLAAEGTPDTVARSISGHRTANVHDRYQITQESAKKAALAAMTARVAEQARRY